MQTLRADHGVFALTFQLEAHSIFEAMRACDEFLVSHGVVDISRSCLVFLGLLKRAVWTDEHVLAGENATVCIERLTGGTFRITLQNKSEWGKNMHIEMHVTHASSIEPDGSSILLNLMKKQFSEEANTSCAADDAAQKEENGHE
jgi:hypothetical protein